MSRRYRSGSIRIDVSEVINEIQDDDLLSECQDRGLTVAAPGETVDIEIIREAHAALSCNRIAEARSILERLLFPKWKTVAKCEEQYEKMV